MTYRIRNIFDCRGPRARCDDAHALLRDELQAVRAEVDERRVRLRRAKDISAGASGADIVKQHDLRPETVQKRDVVPGAISSPTDVSGLVLSAPLYAGEQVTLRRFSDVAAEGIRSQLKGTLRAVQLAGDANQLLAGTLAAGDHVDLVANLRLDTNSNATATRIVLRDLTVLTAPSDLSSSKVSTPSGSMSAVLAVTDTQVQRLFFVMKNADWTLELRPVVGAVDSNERIDTLSTVLQAGAK
jgi:Flp pilus assembly protein CpaB